MKKFLTIVITALLVIGLISIEWLITCGVIKLITMCFSLSFSWSVATGIWLILSLVSLYFRNKE